MTDEQQRNAHEVLTRIKYHHDQVTPQQLDSWVEEVRAALAECDRLEKLAYYDVLSDDGENIVARYEYKKLFIGCCAERDKAVADVRKLREILLRVHSLGLGPKSKPVEQALSDTAGYEE